MHRKVRNQGPEARRNVEDCIKRKLSTVPEVRAAWLFGTFASGEPFEDVDVGVILAQGASVGPRFTSRLAAELERATGEPRLEVDLKVLGKTPYHFQHEVLKTGRLIFYRDEVERIRYETAVMRRFLDYQPARRFLINASLDRSRETGHGG